MSDKCADRRGSKCKECKDREICDTMADSLLLFGKLKVQTFAKKNPGLVSKVMIKIGDPLNVLEDMLRTGTLFSIEYLRTLEKIGQPDNEFDPGKADIAWDEFMTLHLTRRLDA